ARRARARSAAVLPRRLRQLHRTPAGDRRAPGADAMTNARREDLRPEVEKFLAILDEGFPDVTQYSGPEIRREISGRRAPLERRPDMRLARDVAIDGPGGELPLRVYVPHDGDSGPGVPARPMIVFAHGGGFVFCDLDSHD